MTDPIDDAQVKIKALRDKLSPVECMVFEKYHFSTIHGLMTVQEVMELVPHPCLFEVKGLKDFGSARLSMFDVVCTYRALADNSQGSSDEIKTAYEAAKQIYGFHREVAAVLGIHLPVID